MEQQFIQDLYNAHRNAEPIPPPAEVYHVLHELLKLLFPALAEERYESLREFENHYRDIRLDLFNILNTLRNSLPETPEIIEDKFIQRLPGVREMLIMDAQAILQGDPAAVSQTEVIRTYPGFLAIAVYRLAHEFYLLGVPLLPRVLTEYAHGLTGIDIHPAATIGERFCIDHGTGVVVGETVVIGNQVKLYQGVTLGALSVRKEMAQTKRHPTIEDRVVIYAGATILGGDTIIGHDSVVGGNVWITQSVAPFSRVYYRGQAEQLQEESRPERIQTPDIRLQTPDKKKYNLVSRK